MFTTILHSGARMIAFFLLTFSMQQSVFAQSTRDSVTNAMTKILAGAAGKEKHMDGFSYRTVNLQQMSSGTITVEEDDYDYGTDTRNTTRNKYENINWNTLTAFDVAELIGERANDLNRFKVKSWPRLNELEIYEMGGGNIVAIVDFKFTSPLTSTTWKNGKETGSIKEATQIRLFCRLKDMRALLYLCNRLRKMQE